MQKKVLIVAYGWPPDNGAGTHRPLRFSRYLRRFGWEPIILTANPITYTRFDPDLLTRVPKGIEVIRAQHFDPWRSFQSWRSRRLSVVENKHFSILDAGQDHQTSVLKSLKACAKGLVRWLEPRLYHPDYFMGWIAPAVKMAEQQIAHRKVDAILATGGPWSDFEVGYRLSRRWNLPLILDFRDGWTLTYNDFESRRPRWGQKLDRSRLARYFHHAAGVIFLHGGYAECYLESYSEYLNEKKIHLIPNGYEPETLATSVPPRGDFLSICYAGALSLMRYDSLLCALSNLSSRHDLCRKIRLTLVGTDQERELYELCKKYCIENSVRILPTTSFDSVRKITRESHAVLLLGLKPLPGLEMNVPSKVFHYLASGRPILGVLPNNESRRILEQLGAGLVADVDCPEEIEGALLSLFRAWESDTLPQFVVPVDRLDRYSEPNLTKALSRALNLSSPIHPYSRGDADVPDSLKPLRRGV